MCLKDMLNENNYKKLMKIKNSSVHEFVAKYIEICKPNKVFVCTDTDEDIGYIRKSAIDNGEEKPLAVEGHTVHFDNYYDQARDREHTYILLDDDVDLGPIRTKNRDDGLKEIHEIMNGIMKGKELYICFFCLGPPKSVFTIPCIQLTDSAYVAHSEHILYRTGYDEFVRQGEHARYFKFVHSAGELTENKTSKNLHKRRIYIDLANETVYSANTQYGGNTIGLKKLAMRLAIYRASKENWLTEHMLLMGIHGPNNRISYFTGAFPSMCGKTSTAMLEGENIVGDDIIYMRNVDGEARAVNVEKGVFGIIQGINAEDDPIQWKVLHNKGEIIFSNVLVTDEGYPYWNGKDANPPMKGYNHSGEWFKGKKDKDGKEIPYSHPNARFTVSLSLFENTDKLLNAPAGVEVGGIVYGGRDSDTSVPVEESFNWEHGIVMKGASLESERTAAVLGKEGVREFNPMSNLDFLSVPIARYIEMNLNFGKNLKKQPKIFSVNYFLRDRNGNFLNDKNDKKIWFKWMELRIHNDVDAIETPTGKIPFYDDLKRLFKTVIDKNYSIDDYNRQFVLKIPENLRKIDRIEKIYKNIVGTPRIVFEILDNTRKKLIYAKEKYGDYVLPVQLMQ